MAAGVVAGVAAAWRLEEPANTSRLRPLRMAGFFASLLLAGLLGRQVHAIAFSTGGLAWFALAAAGLVMGSRLISRRCGRFEPGELGRWLAVGAAAAGALRPFYTAEMIGAGDAHWYTLMQADVTSQLRAGVFPVWVGQSTYAYNGAVMPIRYAPGFQYFGGALDLLTAHVLHPTALKNLTLVIAALIGAGVAYFCLAKILPNRRWAACLLATLWLWCPGVLAPVTVGDQYMTFLTLPGVALALYGCWRWTVDESPVGPLACAVGLSATWCCHPPVAFWSTIISSGIGLYAMLENPARRWRQAALFGVTFAALGSYPFVSVFTLENRLHDKVPGLVVAEQVEAAFPINLKPINAIAPGIGSYQLGYFLLALWAVTLALALRTPGRGFRPQLVASLLLVPITIPIPGLTRGLWQHAPAWLIQLNNVWPMQRFFLIWSALIVFAAAALLRCRAPLPRRWRQLSWLLALLALSWPLREGLKLDDAASRTRSLKGTAQLMESPDDVLISRYAYGAFEFTPAYASHGFVDPWFENRLLDRETQASVIANAEAAAPLSVPAGSTDGRTRLVQAGSFQAKNISGSDYYELQPRLTLEPGRHYALRFECAPPGLAGTFQFSDNGLFREYLLPDSGAGMLRHGPSLAFGSLATSSAVLSLTDDSPQPNSPLGLLITQRATRADFNAGRFWLYDYDRAKLPVAVDSWIPYRAHLLAPRPLYLETPRMWLRGWHAHVNGRPTKVLRSKQNLVMVAVETGPNVVTLDYEPSWALGISFWVSLVTWTLLAIYAIGRAITGRFPGLALTRSIANP